MQVQLASGWLRKLYRRPLRSVVFGVKFGSNRSRKPYGLRRHRQAHMSTACDVDSKTATLA